MNTELALKHFHSYWAIIVVALSLITAIIFFSCFFTKKKLTPILRKISFYTVLSYHIQFIVGIALYAFSSKIESYWKAGTAMKEGRLLSLEHPMMMFTAVILITIANAKLKRTEFVTKSILIFTILALACFFMIPWMQWLA